MTKVLPFLILIVGVGCQSVHQSADPYFRDGVYSLHDGGNLIVSSEETEVDTSYYDAYVLPPVGTAEESFSPYETQNSYMGYSGPQFYQTNFSNDSYYNNGYGSGGINPYFGSSCGMGMNWGILFGVSYNPYYNSPYAGSYYPYGTYSSGYDFGSPVSAPRTHQLYSHYIFQPESNRSPEVEKIRHGFTRMGQDNHQAGMNQRGLASWLESFGSTQTGNANRKNTGFQNFMRDLGRGLETMSTDQSRSSGKSGPSVGGNSGSKSRSGSSGGGARSGGNTSVGGRGGR